MSNRTTGTKNRRKRVSNEDLLKYEESIIRRRYAILYTVGILLFALIGITVYVLWKNGSIGWALLTAIMVVPLFIVMQHIYERIEDQEIHVYLRDDVDRYKDYALRQGNDYYTMKKKVDAAIKKWDKAYVAAYGDEFPVVDYNRQKHQVVVVKRRASHPTPDKQAIEKEKNLRAIRDELCKQAVSQMKECLDDEELEALINNDADEIMRLYGVLYLRE